jgi:hypothetical protein
MKIIQTIFTYAKNQLSFPLVGNLSSEGFWPSQNDILGTGSDT